MPKLYSVRFEIGETLAEYKVARAALIRFQAGVQSAQPGFQPPNGTHPRHVDRALEELEGTYLVGGEEAQSGCPRLLIGIL